MTTQSAQVAVPHIAHESQEMTSVDIPASSQRGVTRLRLVVYEGRLVVYEGQRRGQRRARAKNVSLVTTLAPAARTSLTTA